MVQIIWSYEVNAAKARILTAAVQALASVSREVTFSAEAGGSLCLSAMPDGQACYGEIKFSGDIFFTKVHRVERTSIGCKVLAKSLLPALRRATAKSGVGGISAVYTLHIRHERGDDDEAPRLTLEIEHEDGTRRRWRLFYEQSDLAFVPEFEERENGEISAAPLQFLSIFEHVGSGNIEISIEDGLLITGNPSETDSLPNIEDNATIRKRAQAQIRISETDLDILKLPNTILPGHEFKLHFHAKQFKALAKFADIFGSSVLRLRCTQPGQPIALDAESPAGATATFLISTAIPLHVASNLSSTTNNNAGISEVPSNLGHALTSSSSRNCSMHGHSASPYISTTEKANHTNSSQIQQSLLPSAVF